MSIHLLKSTSILCVSLGLLAACSSTPPAKMEEKAAATPASGAVVSTALEKPAAPAASKVVTVAVRPYLDPANPLATRRSIYFDYDNFAVGSEFSPMLEMHGKFLAANPAVAIRVEGNADERGSKEYNLALGQKRAESVFRALKVYGVKESQMEAVSWGEEKPIAQGQDEAAFSQNRRVDLAYPSK